MSHLGVIARGIRTPIIRKGDDLSTIVVDSLLKAQKDENFIFEDKDIVAVTEAVVGISQGNYATLDQIAEDIKLKFKSEHIGLVFPILSRNRFENILRAISRGTSKVTILLSFPKDEVGNSIMYETDLERLNINLYSDIIKEDLYNKEFSNFTHPFTKINMVEYYRKVVLSEKKEVEFVFSNNPCDILKYTKDILVCDIHTRKETKEKISKHSYHTLLTLSDILTSPVMNSGFNREYGLYGSNAAGKEVVKLFPHHNDPIVYNIQNKLKEITGKTLEVMIYGDGAFKDPVGQIWELADPVVSPSYTKGLEGTPNEIKLKYMSDDKYKHLSGKALEKAIHDEISKKSNNPTDDSKLGTTPRRYVDLIGSLCDLMSGSGDKGTPVIYIKNYFKNITD
ncbi:coenzyme F420-0:L-glutamate ligase [Acholeplasma granularum]|uniref:coenzyme F420-0:L-glutamate ligase n=1 Tax=Acholeplasma granularum TaxID=264635 RepID=UPI0004722569|nr:coenzyme F420-0:L-glutamate ligase [Acholeplasma granularum]